MMGAKQLRHELADYLADAMPDTVVIAYPNVPDQPVAQTIVMATSAVKPPALACPTPTYTIDLWLICPYTDGAPANDALDDFTDEVITVLDLGGYDWQQASRGTFGSTNPSYSLTVEVS